MRLARPALLAATAILLSTLTAQAKGPTHIDPEKAAKADPDFSIQGEYAGEMKTESGPKKAGVQVIALGGGKFQAVGYTGGLPGAGWNQDKKPERVQGSLKDGKVVFEGKYATGTIQDGVMKITGKGGEAMGQLKRIERKSPTLGAKPPEGAVVLFDGKSADQWSLRGGKQPLMTEEGLLTQGVISKPKFGSHKLHIEFRLPYQPQNRGQGRGRQRPQVEVLPQVQRGPGRLQLSASHDPDRGGHLVQRPSFARRRDDHRGDRERLRPKAQRHRGRVARAHLDLRPCGGEAQPFGYDCARSRGDAGEDESAVVVGDRVAERSLDEDARLGDGSSGVDLDHFAHDTSRLLRGGRGDRAVGQAAAERR